MKRTLQFVPTYVTIFLILGIITGYFFLINPLLIISLLIVGIITLIIVYNKVNQYSKYNLYFGFVLIILSFIIGVSTITFKNEHNSKLHYQHFIVKETSSDYVYNQKYILKLEVRKVFKPTNRQHKYVAKVVAVNNQKTIGKVLLNILTDSLSKQFKVDQTLLIYAEFKPIEPPKNPYYFDYRNYLKKQQIQHQLFTKKNEYKVLAKNNTMVGMAEQLIAIINLKLVPYAIAKEELAIINAFLLGDRQDVSNYLMESYINAGAIHIMAISGMHFGILFLILNALLKPIERFKNGKIWKMFLIVLLLWMYALIAGLSGSIVRAVLMFSIFAIAINLYKLTNIYYTLIVSLLILLLLNPYFLFEVGFQLSYVAVFSIIIFQPIFQSIWVPKNRFVMFYWDIFTVSLAAQIGVLPISLFYFHQFPGLFMLTNFVIIPFLGIILIGGILVFILALLNALPAILVQLYTSLIFLMNAVVKWIGAQESFLIKEIPFDGWLLISLYTIIFCSIIYLKRQNNRHLKLFLISVIAFQLVLLFHKSKNENNQEMVIFHKSKQSIIADKIGSQLKLYLASDTISIRNEKIITAYTIGNSVLKTQFKKPQNVFYRNNQSILVIDSLGIYKVGDFIPDIILLQYSPKINLNRLIEELNPKQVIADGSNFSSYVNLWNETCLKRKTPFHHTGQKGAYILK